MFKKENYLMLVLVIGFGLFNTNLIAQDDAEEDVEEVVVTGSRIATSEFTGAQPVVVIDQEDIARTAELSVAEVLRELPINVTGSFYERSGSSAGSQAQLSLRGLGAGRTLVLIDGRRIPSSPKLGGESANINTIPTAAVERIEILADGASAVYGSDAVAGVINIIMKDEYEGLEVKTRYGSRSRDGGEELGVSLLAGASTDRGSFVAGFEHDSRDPIFDADRSFTAARKIDSNGDGVIQGYQETEGISIYGYTLLNPAYDSTLGYDADNTDSWLYHPGANCSESNGFQGEMEYFGLGKYCGYAYALVSANRASLDRNNAWISADYEITDDVELFFDLVWTGTESFGRYAPPAAPGPVIPGDPRNVIVSPTQGEIQATSGYFRWTDIGFRDNVVNDNLLDINLGVKGSLSDNISWEAYATVSEYVATSVGTYYLSYAGLDYNINNDVADFDEFVAKHWGCRFKSIEYSD